MGYSMAISIAKEIPTSVNVKNSAKWAPRPKQLCSILGNFSMRKQHGISFLCHGIHPLNISY